MVTAFWLVLVFQTESNKTKEVLVVAGADMAWPVGGLGLWLRVKGLHLLPPALLARGGRER